MQTLCKKGSIALKALACFISAALVLSLSPICRSVAYAGETAAIKVYIQEGDAGSPKSAWSFSRAELEALATSAATSADAKSALAVQKGAWNTYVSKQYITVADLFTAVDTARSNNSKQALNIASQWTTGAKIKVASGTTTREVSYLDGKYWTVPGTEQGAIRDMDKTDPKEPMTQSPLLLSLQTYSAAIGSAPSTSADVVSDAYDAENASKISSDITIMYGMTVGQYKASWDSTNSVLKQNDDNKGGRFLSGIDSITLIVPGSGEVTPTGYDTPDPLETELVTTITSAADLVKFANGVNSGLSTKGKTITLAADIDLSGINWTPIAFSESNIFKGTFDGAGYTISGLSMTTDNALAALFGYSKGTIKNVTVSGAIKSTTKGDYVAGVVAVNSGEVTGVISNVTVEAMDGLNVGGIAGKNEGTISECMTRGNVSGLKHVGGIAGLNYGMIKSCSTSGTIDGIDAGSKNGVGGIAGYNGDKDQAFAALIENCYFNGKVGRSGQSWVGGITGFNNARSSVKNCYVSGTVVEGAHSYNPIAGSIDDLTGGVYTNNYSLEGIPAADPADAAKAGTVKTADEMKASEFVTALGDAYKTVDGDFPILTWQTATDKSMPKTGDESPVLPLGIALAIAGAVCWTMKRRLAE